MKVVEDKDLVRHGASKGVALRRGNEILVAQNSEEANVEGYLVFLPLMHD